MLLILMRRTTITFHHPSMVVWLLLSLHWGWALGIANALTFDRTQLRSYGQVLSLFVPIPALWSFGKILRDHRVTILRSLKATPMSLREGVCFTFTGRKKWDTPPVERDYFKWSRLKWVIGECIRSTSRAPEGWLKYAQCFGARLHTWDFTASGSLSMFGQARCPTVETKSTTRTRIGNLTRSAVRG